MHVCVCASSEPTCGGCGFRRSTKDRLLIVVFPLVPLVTQFTPHHSPLDDAYMKHVHYSHISKTYLRLMCAQGFRALAAFRTQHGALPAPGDTQQADAVLKLALQLNGNNSDTNISNGATNGDASSSSHAASTNSAYVSEALKDEAQQAECAKIITALARTARGVMSPMCATIGGVVGKTATTHSYIISLVMHECMHVINVLHMRLLLKRNVCRTSNDACCFQIR